MLPLLTQTVSYETSGLVERTDFLLQLLPLLALFTLCAGSIHTFQASSLPVKLRTFGNILLKLG